jgi:hypothetical protein
MLGSRTVSSPPASLNETVYSYSRYLMFCLRRSKDIEDKEDMSKHAYNLALRVELKSDSLFIKALPKGTPYLVDGVTHRMFEISRRNDEFLAYLFQRYGLNPEDWLTASLAAAFRATAIARGRPRTVRRFAFWNNDRKVCYLSRYNGTALRLAGANGIDVAPNGEEVLFSDDDGGNAPYTPDIAPHGALLPMLTSLNWAANTPGHMRPIDQTRALTVWVLALAFPDLFITKPLLIVEGAPGSGKSASMQIIQQAVHGRTRPLIIGKKREDDFSTQILRSPIAVLDNVDSYIDWLPDAVCAYTTSGVWVKRKLYTDDDEHELHPQAFLAVASKNPASFRREDVADRTIVLRLDRRDDFTPMAVIRQQIESGREELYGEWVYYVNEVVTEIQKHGMPMSSNHRMADWESFARVVGRVVGWTSEDVDEMMAALQRERDAFAGEGDSLVELISRWLDQSANVAREVTAQKLHDELGVLAAHFKKPLVRSANALAQKLRAPYLEAYFEIETSTGRGNTRTYRIRRPDKD